MSPAVAKTVRNARRDAQRSNQPRYVVPTAYGPRVDQRPAAFRGKCYKVNVDGSVEQAGRWEFA